MISIRKERKHNYEIQKEHNTKIEDIRIAYVSGDAFYGRRYTEKLHISIAILLNFSCIFNTLFCATILNYI